MSKRLLTLNVFLVAISLACLAYIVQAAILTPAAALPRAGSPAPGAPAAPRPGSVDRAPSQGYAVVATRNLFSPTRNEATSVAPAGDGRTLPRPSLYGVVLGDGARLAYLEDPVTKRVAGYRLGDSIAGGTLQAIAADRVVIARADGTVEVPLHDPARPRRAEPTRPPGIPAPPSGAPTVEAPPPPAPPQPPPAPNIIRRPPPMSPDAPPR
jgi:hypothetical protein